MFIYVCLIAFIIEGGESSNEPDDEKKIYVRALNLLDAIRKALQFTEPENVKKVLEVREAEIFCEIDID